MSFPMEHLYVSDPEVVTGTGVALGPATIDMVVTG